MTCYAAASEDEKFASVRGINRWIEQVLGSGSGFNNFSPGENWLPGVNICEHENHFWVIVDIAGINPETLCMTPQGDVLVISGEREMPRILDETGKMKVHLMEIDYGRFSRSVQLPPEADLSSVPEGKYRAGFLYVRLSKKKG